MLLLHISVVVPDSCLHYTLFKRWSNPWCHAQNCSCPFTLSFLYWNYSNAWIRIRLLRGLQCHWYFSIPKFHFLIVFYIWRKWQSHIHSRTQVCFDSACFPEANVFRENFWKVWVPAANDIVLCLWPDSIYHVIPHVCVPILHLFCGAQHGNRPWRQFGRIFGSFPEDAPPDIHNISRPAWHAHLYKDSGAGRLTFQDHQHCFDLADLVHTSVFLAGYHAQFLNCSHLWNIWSGLHHLKDYRIQA